MTLRIKIALIILFVVVVLGAILLAWPAPLQNNGTPPPPVAQPFTSENVKVDEPLPNALVPKTFRVAGEARGTWYFEASFPVQVRDPDNNVVGQGIAQAGADWTTTEFVPFVAWPVVVTDYSGPAMLVLLKDNPSGLPENEDSVEFPIVLE